MLDRIRTHGRRLVALLAVAAVVYGADPRAAFEAEHDHRLASVEADSCCVARVRSCCSAPPRAVLAAACDCCVPSPQPPIEPDGRISVVAREEAKAPARETTTVARAIPPPTSTGGAVAIAKAPVAGGPSIILRTCRFRC